MLSLLLYSLLACFDARIFVEIKTAIHISASNFCGYVITKVFNGLTFYAATCWFGEFRAMKIALFNWANIHPLNAKIL